MRYLVHNDGVREVLSGDAIPVLRRGDTILTLPDLPPRQASISRKCSRCGAVNSIYDGT